MDEPWNSIEFDAEAVASGVATATCSACLDDIDLTVDPKWWVELKCKHPIHTDCVRQLPRAECPLCRRPISADALSPELFGLLNESETKYKENLEAEREEALRRMLASESRGPPVQPPLQFEIFLALSYLAAIGIPPSLFPDRIDLAIDCRCPCPAYGSMFRFVVSSICKSLSRDLGVEEGVEAEVEEVVEVVDDPFAELTFEGVVEVITVPARGSMEAARQVPFLWNTMRIPREKLVTAATD